MTAGFNRRRAIKATLGSLLGSGIGQCAAATTTGPSSEITVWAWDVNFNAAVMQDAAKRYAAKHPGFSVKVVDMAKSDLEQKLQIALASGVSRSLPDIVLIEDYNAPKYLRSFRGAFEPLSGRVNHAGFAKYKVDLMTVDGKVYGIPFDTGVTALYYRKDILASAGFAEKDLEGITWDRYIEIGKAVVAATNKKMICINPFDNGLLRAMVQSGGRWYFDKDGKLDIRGNPALRATLDIQARMVKAGIIKPSTNWAEWVGAINRGDVATVVAGPWVTASIKAEKKQSGLWGVVPMPSLGVPGAVNVSNDGGSSWYVLSSSKSKAQAVDFLGQVFANDLQFYQEILLSRGAMGSLLAARSGPAYSAPDAFFGGARIWQQLSDYVSKVPSVNYGAFTAEAGAAVNAQLPALMRGTSTDKVIDAIHTQLASQVR